MMNEKFKEFIQNFNTFVFVGNGGTGKTTLSASWAIEAAKTGKKVGLLTIDPSKRLGDVFGMNLQTETFKSVPVGEGSVDVHLIDSQRVIKEFVVQHFSQVEYDKLQKNRIFSQITAVLSDNQSLSTIYKLNELIKSKKYDIFVVDTPPSNNSMDFFTTPDFVIRIFKENILAKAALEAKSFSFFSGKNLFRKVFTFLVGEDFYKEVEVFFQILLLFQEHIVASSQELMQLLKDSKTCFLLVTLPDESKVQEILAVAKGLKEQKILAEHLLINRAYPDWLPLENKSQAFESNHPEIQNFYDKVYVYYHNQMKTAQELARGLNQQLKVFFVPESTTTLETPVGENALATTVEGFSSNILAIFEEKI